jgi:hypothetical protein
LLFPPSEIKIEYIVMKIVRYIVPVMGTPGEQGNLLGQVTVGISIDHSDLVAVMQCIGAVVSKVGLYAVPLIPDTVIDHLRIRGRLEVGPTFLTLLWTTQNPAENGVELKSTSHCRCLQSLG